jgi:hypothetical protein
MTTFLEWLHKKNAAEALHLYIFADHYDTQSLRNAYFNVFFAFIEKAKEWRSASAGSTDKLWNPSFLVLIHKNVLESSGLYRLIVDDQVWNLHFSSEKEAAKWIDRTPVALAGRKMYRCSKGKLRLQVCKYHEYEFLAMKFGKSPGICLLPCKMERP